MKKLKIQGEVLEISFEEVYESFTGFRFKMFKTYMGRMTSIGIENEDLRQEIDMEFWNAYQQYSYENSNGVAFITFATIHIEGKLKSLIKKQFASKRLSNTSVLYLNDKTADNSNLEFIDLLEVRSFEDDVIATINLEQAIKRCNPHQIRIIKLLAAGYQGKEVAELVGTTKQYISFVKNQFCERAKLKNAM